MTNTEIRNQIEREGLIPLGIVGLEYPEEYRRFEEWIAEGRHADLKFLENHPHVRKNPAKLLDGARSAIIVGLPYGDSAQAPPQVARYARYADYHKVLREKAERVAGRLFDVGGYRVTVDSAPILERALAARTHRGFIGKNTLFIHPDHGSFLLLGEILTTVDLPFDSPHLPPLDRKTKDGGCGPCQLCQTACPTGALDRNYSLDASKCLSYWTIENRGTIPERFWPWLKDYYFGCDICQVVCPYNKKAKPAPPDWKRREYPSLDAVASMSQQEYEAYFGGTPMTRAKRSGLRRNALIAMAVTKDPRLKTALDLIDPKEEMLFETRRQIERYQEQAS